MSCRNLLCVGLAAAVVGAGAASRAAVVPFDINPDISASPGSVIPGGNLIDSDFTYYNIQFNVDGAPADINIRTALASKPAGPGVDQVVSDGFNGSSIVTKGDNSYLNTPFAAGDVIGDGVDEFVRLADQFSVINDGGDQRYSPGANYLGFKLPGGNYGWVYVDYDAANSTYTFHSGAYENSGAAITAGVPEPASLALAATGLVAASGLRRTMRRRGK